MTDEARHSDPLNQNHVPESFVALHTEPGRVKPSVSRSELLERHALCEDMAQMLTEHAATLQFSHDLSEAETLRRVLQGLLPKGGALEGGALEGGALETGQLAPTEALWVVCRLAESLGWPLPGDMAQGMDERARQWLAQVTRRG
jgi:hypothetical protein